MSDEKYLVAQSSAPAFTATMVGMQGAVGLAAAPSIGDKKASEFAAEVVALVKNKEFLTELSNDVGEPTKFETEEQFVARAKEAMRALLKSKLK